MHSRELVLPGSPSEMSEFEQHAINLAQYSVLCTLPLVNVHIPSKKFLQILYHRLVMCARNVSSYQNKKNKKEFKA